MGSAESHSRSDAFCWVGAKVGAAAGVRHTRHKRRESQKGRCSWRGRKRHEADVAFNFINTYGESTPT